MTLGTAPQVVNPFCIYESLTDSHARLSGMRGQLASELRKLLDEVVGEYADADMEIPPDLEFRYRRLRQIENSMAAGNNEHPVFNDKELVPFFNPDEPFGLIKMLQLKRLGRIFPAVIFNPMYWMEAGYHYKMVQTRENWSYNESSCEEFVTKLIEASLSVGSDGFLPAQQFEVKFYLSVVHEGSHVGTTLIWLRTELAMLASSADVVDIHYSVADDKTKEFHSAMRIAFALEQFQKLASFLNKIREFFANGWRTVIEWPHV